MTCKPNSPDRLFSPSPTLSDIFPELSSPARLSSKPKGASARIEALIDERRIYGVIVVSKFSNGPKDKMARTQERRNKRAWTRFKEFAGKDAPLTASVMLDNQYSLEKIPTWATG